MSNESNEQTFSHIPSLFLAKCLFILAHNKIAMFYTTKNLARERIKKFDSKVKESSSNLPPIFW